MTLCECCAVAALRDDDRFCYWCGGPLRRIELSVEPEHLLLPDDREAECWATGRIRNVGQWGVQARLEMADQGWATLATADGAPINNAVWLVAPRDTADFRVRIDPARAALGSGAVRLQAWIMDAGPESGPRAADATGELRVSPQPRFGLRMSQETALWMDEEHPPLLRVAVDRSAGSDARLNGVESSSGWASVRLEQDGGEPVACVQVEVAALLKELDGSRPVSVTLPLVLTTEAPPSRSRQEVQVHLVWPASLEFQPGVPPLDGPPHRYSLPPGDVHLVPVTLRNSGGRPVTVLRAETTTDQGEADLLLGRVERLPRVLAPEEGLASEVAVHLPWGGPGEPMHVRIGAEGKSDTDLRAELDLQIDPRPIAVFNGAVALDFGTTNSCAAVADLRGDPRVGIMDGELARINREPSLARDVLPSAILYEFVLPGGTRVASVGSAAADRSERTVLSVKRRFGTGQRTLCVCELDGSRHELTAEEVVGDTFRRMIAGLESRLERRIQECALTYPVSFTPGQVRRLAEVLEQTTGVKAHALIPEPVAAALHEIRERPPQPGESSEYVVLVFDIGGGTTDLAVVSVYDRMDERDVRTLRPDVRKVRGLRWAGGDDITWQAIRRFVRGSNEPGLDRETRRKVLGLEREEELDALLSLAEMHPSCRSQPSGALLRAFRDADRAKQAWTEEHYGGPRYEGSGSHLFTAAEQLSGDVDAFWTDFGMEALVRDVLARGEVEVPDVVLLVGRSWRIPRLLERVRAMFPDVDIKNPAAGLKETVALGACFCEEVLRGPHPFDVELGHLRPISAARIGISVFPTDGGTHKRFREVIPPGDATGGWIPVNGILPRRGSHLVVVENMGTTDDMDIRWNEGTAPNPDILELAVVALDFPELNQKSDAQVRADGRVMMRLDEEHQVQVRFSVQDLSHTWTLPRTPS